MQSKRKQGHIPWNKGKTGVYSDEQLKKFSEARKQATTSETIKKIKEARAKQDMSWRHNWHPSDEARQKMRERHLGKKHTEDWISKMKTLSKERLSDIRLGYKKYKNDGGALTWNDFQKALKNGEIIV